MCSISKPHQEPKNLELMGSRIVSVMRMIMGISLQIRTKAERLFLLCVKLWNIFKETLLFHILAQNILLAKT